MQPTVEWSKRAGANDHWVWHSPQRGDSEFEGVYATGDGDKVTDVPPGSSDASMTPYHIDRGKMFIRERFGGKGLVQVVPLDALDTAAECFLASAARLFS